MTRNQILLEKDYLTLLETMGLEPPSGPIGYQHFNQDGTPIFESDAYQELHKLASPEKIKQLAVELQNNRTGYEHVVDSFRTTRFAPFLDYIFFAEYPTGLFNAQAKRTEHGYLCLLNRGMRQFLYGMAMATYYSVVDDAIHDPEASDPQQRELRNITRFGYAASNCMRYVRGDPTRTIFEGQHHTRTAMIWGGGAFGAMRDFVVAHEIAHMALGHLKQPKSQFILTPVGNLEVVKKSHEQEFAADRLAQDILFELSVENGIGTLTGGLSFLMIDRILAMFRETIFGERKEGSPTHPSSEDRFEALFQHIKHRLKPHDLQRVIDMVSAFETIRWGMVCIKITKGGIEFDYVLYQQYLKQLAAELG